MGQNLAMTQTDEATALKCSFYVRPNFSKHTQ